MRVPVTLYLWLCTCFIFVFTFLYHSFMCEVIAHYVLFWLVFSSENDAEYIFMCLLAICIYSWEKYLFKYFPSFNGFILLCWAVRVLYFVLCLMHDLQILSSILWVILLTKDSILWYTHFVWCIPVYLIFSLVASFLVSCLKNYSPIQYCQYLYLCFLLRVL